MSVLILQHHEAYKPGRLGLTLRDHGFAMDIRSAAHDAPLPRDLEDVDAVVALGGPQQSSEGHHWMQREAEFLALASNAGLPVVAIGLGAHLLAMGLGGEVTEMAAPEAGFVAVDILPSGQTDTILSGIPWTSRQFMRHAQCVSKLPPGARSLAKSSRTPAQCFSVNLRTYAFEFHIECDHAMIDDLLSGAKTMLHASGTTTEEFEEHRRVSYDAYARIADRLCVNICTYLIPRVATAAHR